MDPPPSLLRELAHELRDALSPVRSSIDLMRLRGFDAEASDQMARRIEQGLERAFATLDAFIIAEQCETGTATLTPGRIPLERLLALAAEALPAALKERCVFMPPRPAVVVAADTARSVQVLTAMLQRALRCAPPGTPIAVQTACDERHAQVRVGFAVGPGSAAGEDWFTSYRGPGGQLALRTARSLMRLQQGNLELLAARSAAWELIATFMRESVAEAAAPHSAPPGGDAGAATAGGPTAADSGAPAAGEAAATRAAASSAARPPSPGRSGARIMVVEDNEEVRRAYREALSLMGYAVTEARNAEEALGAALDPLPAVALIDINLPGMSGYRLAQALRARFGDAMRLVMLSGVTLDDTTVQLSKNAGFDRCFDKAAGPKALQSLLLGLL